MKAVVSMRVQFMLHHWGKKHLLKLTFGNRYVYNFIFHALCIYHVRKTVFMPAGSLHFTDFTGVEKSLMPYSQVFMFFYRFGFPLGELLSHSTLRFSTSWVGARVATFILALHKINTAVAYHCFVWFAWIFAVCNCIAISRRLYCLKRFSLLDWRRCITLYMKTSLSTSMSH